MTAWTTLPNGAVAAGGLPSGETVTALRDNVAATAEGAPGAPVLSAGWHPYNKVTVGDSNTGLIYDFGVSGAVTTIVTPDFVDGYEYMLRFAGISFSAPGQFRVDPFREVDAAYQSLIVTPSNPSAGLPYEGMLRVIFPRLAKVSHPVQWETDFAIQASGGVLAFAGTAYQASDATLQKILRARVIISAGTINGGKVYMNRRREYITG